MYVIHLLEILINFKKDWQLRELATLTSVLLTWLMDLAGGGSGGACTAATPAYLQKIEAAAVANPKCIAYGQQSNGCWHLLQWDSATTGANKKTKSMYPDYFKVTKPPTDAQCQIGGDAATSSTANSGYLGGYIYKTEAAADAACKAKGWKGLCQKVDVPPKCATGWYAGATTSTVGFHMDKDTAGFGDEGCGGGSTAWKTDVNVASSLSCQSFLKLISISNR